MKFKLAESLRKNKKSAGFTLVEALVTVIFFSLILGACYLILLAGTDSWQVNSVKIEIQQEARKAADWIKQDLIQSGASTITNVPADGNWYTTITFKTTTGASGGNIAWSSQTTQFLLSSNQLIRRTATDKVCAKDIQALQFRRQAASPSIVTVSVQTQKNTTKGLTLTMTSNFEVKMRN